VAEEVSTGKVGSPASLEAEAQVEVEVEVLIPK
jgi:hypothetical protein